VFRRFSEGLGDNKHGSNSNQRNNIVCLSGKKVRPDQSYSITGLS
jgi:hypothetical protein